MHQATINPFPHSNNLQWWLISLSQHCPTMKNVRRHQPEANVPERTKKTLFQLRKVRPLTSHGNANTTPPSSTDKGQLATPKERPKTAIGLHRKKLTTRMLSSTDYANERTGRSKSSLGRERPATTETREEKRDRSVSLSSNFSESSRHKRSSRTKSHTVPASVTSGRNQSMKQNRSSIKHPAKSDDLANEYFIHDRKVAWESDTGDLNLQSLQLSSKDELSAKTKVERRAENESVIGNDFKESGKDLFQPPDLTGDESCDEYETELEDHQPVAVKQFDCSGHRTYLKLCKQEDVLPVSGLTNQFTEKEMAVRHRGLGWKGTKTLADSLVKNVFVEKLDLADNYIEGVGASFVARMLADNCYITQLVRIKYASLSTVYTSRLIQLTGDQNSIGLTNHSAPCKTVRQVATFSNQDLSQNFIGATGGTALADMLITNQVLRKVTLRANRLTDRVAKHFATALRENRTLWHLDLSHNEIGEQGAVYFGAGLGLNYGLKHLDLSWNCIRGKGGVAIAQALKTNDSLTTLNLSWNGISLLGCVALGKFLRRNENLKELDLRNNRIGYLGAQRICPGIAKSNSLEVFKVGLNPIGDDGVHALLKAVKTNKSLKYLGLEDVTVSATADGDIQQLEQNRQMKIVTGGLGGFKKPKEMPQRMAILLDFIKVNRLRLVDWFHQFDKDHSGDITKDEFKIGLKETGLKMTQKQLDTLIEYLDVDNNGKIEYSELLIGRDHTLREQRDFRMAQQKLRNMEDMRARLPAIEGFEPE